MAYIALATESLQIFRSHPRRSIPFQWYNIQKGYLYFTYKKGDYMNISIPIMGLIAVMILVLGVFAVRQKKKQMEIQKKYPGYPKDYWKGQGLGTGIAIGAGLGAALGNIAIGVGIGVAIGAAIGSNLEKQHKDEIRPITDEEKELQKQSTLFAVGILLVGVVVFVLVYFVAK